MTDRPQVRLDTKGRPYVRGADDGLGESWHTTDTALTFSGDDLTPAVVLTEDDAEELAEEWLGHNPHISDAARRDTALYAAQVIRRLIAAREADHD